MLVLALILLVVIIALLSSHHGSPARGARTGATQLLQSFTVAPIVHLSRLIPDLRPLGVAYSRTRHAVDWVDVRFEYRLGTSNQSVFADAAAGVPIASATNTAHTVTTQLVVNY